MGGVRTLEAGFYRKPQGLGGWRRNNGPQCCRCAELPHPVAGIFAPGRLATFSTPPSPLLLRADEPIRQAV